ncbi:MAG TPA: hypothetical protein DF712_07995 [Balneola sp.]|nr:hypothetical protein [Balneola sp.]|tara:strand:+ start:486 stop:749 length:264 start_codon:yes stop_codon:yes gene_type:complete
MATTSKKYSLGTLAILAGWAVTILTVFWQIAMKDATYASSIEELEKDVDNISMRVNTTEDFRITIVEQLAEIKTDLTWIKDRLDQIE